MAQIKEKVDTFLVRRLVDGPASADAHPFRKRIAAGLYAAIHGITEEELNLRSMSLVYTTLLSIVPLLALSFSVLKAFGVHTQFEIFIYYLLEPLGEKGVDLSMQIIGFVENIKISVLGSIGLSLLVYTVLSQIQKVESALNYIWGIRKMRTFANRFSNYLSVLLVGPIFIFSAIGVTASLMSATVVSTLKGIYPLGTIIVLFMKVLPYFLASAGFGFIYLFLPNTKVRVSSALAGGIFAGVAWKTIGWVFTTFVGSSAKYSAIYSGFAVVILSLIWLYWTWLVLLVGASVSAAYQNPGAPLQGRKGYALPGALREDAAVSVMLFIGLRFYRGETAWDTADMAESLGFSVQTVEDMLQVLSQEGLVLATETPLHAYVPARPLEKIAVADIVNTARNGKIAGKAAFSSIAALTGQLMGRISSSVASSLEGMTLLDLVSAADKSDAS